MTSSGDFWKTFAAHWNGTSLIIHPNSRKVTLTSDASGSWGCGAWHDQKWFQLQWDATNSQLHIAAKELIPIIVAATIWGHLWLGSRVITHGDNSAVVSIINSRYCKDTCLMQMLRCLFFIEAHFQCQVSAVHVPGVCNNLADRLASFFSKMRSAERNPSPIPHSLLQWLLDPKLDWTSPNWMERFNFIVRRE